MSDKVSVVEILSNAVGDGDELKVTEVVESFQPSKASDDEQIQFLETLKRSRYFNHLDTVSSKLMGAGISSPQIAKLASQAKIELGNLDSAEALLSTENINLNWGQSEKSEIVGLLGRVNKQKFVATSEQSFLTQSIGYYDQGWQNRVGDYRWHGINSVALRARLDRDNSSSQQQEIIETMSREILSDIKQRDESHAAQPWDYATAMEASLAVSDYDEMFHWARKYAASSVVDSFQLAGTIRQLNEIWQIKKNPEGKQLMPALQFELVNRPGSSVSVESVEFYDGKGFEAFYGNDGTQFLQWFKTLISKCKSVVKIRNKTDGRGVGTGFIVNSSDLNPKWSEKPLLMTNSHVVCDDGSEPKALTPDQAEVEFTEVENRPTCSIGKKIVSSSRDEFDFWLSEIDCPEIAIPLSLSQFNPAVPLDSGQTERVYVVGHPRGGDLSVSMHGNALVGYEEQYVHYKSPTDKGCSGGPAMNQNLDSFAIHHRSRDELSVNQGVLLSEIKSFLN